jgi:hypothetical protein
LKTLGFLELFTELNLSFMAHLVCEMKFAHCVRQIIVCRLQLLLDL